MTNLAIWEPKHTTSNNNHIKLCKIIREKQNKKCYNNLLRVFLFWRRLGRRQSLSAGKQLPHGRIGFEAVIRNQHVVAKFKRQRHFGRFRRADASILVIGQLRFSDSLFVEATIGHLLIGGTFRGAITAVPFPFVL